MYVEWHMQKRMKREEEEKLCDINGFTLDVFPFLLLLLQTCIYYNENDDDDDNGLCVAHWD